MKKYVPLDLPQNLDGFWLLFPPDFRESMQECIKQQYAAGNFRSTEDIMCDESNKNAVLVLLSPEGCRSHH